MIYDHSVLHRMPKLESPMVQCEFPIAIERHQIPAQPFRKIDRGWLVGSPSGRAFITLGRLSAVDSYFRIRIVCFICGVSYGIYTLR